MDISFYKKPKEKPNDNVTFTEQVKIYDDNGKTLLNYHFFRPSPFCVDGYKHEMDEYLEQKGWSIGMMGLTYKDGIGLEEIIYCISYRKAYQRVYNSVVKGHPLKDVDMKIKEFIDLVDEKVVQIMKLYEKVPVKSMEDTINLLKEEDFIQL